MTGMSSVSTQSALIALMKSQAGSLYPLYLPLNSLTHCQICSRDTTTSQNIEQMSYKNPTALATYVYTASGLCT